MRTFKTVFKFVLAAFFILAGVNHFFSADFYMRIMPSYLPAPLLLVYLSGVAEIGLGLLLIFPRCQYAAAWGLIALLVAVFPANIHMAVNNDLYPDYNPTALWLRLPMQLIFIALCYWYTQRDGQPDKPQRIR